MPFNNEQLNEFVFPFCGNDPDTDIMLFFTDNKNEPKSINIRRCIESDTDFTGNPFDYDGQELEDFINACPRVPNKAIQFDFELVTDDNGVLLESNFKQSNGLIFAYQNVYKNGYVSSLSNYSKVAYAPAIAVLGNRALEEVIISNKITLSIPKQSEEVRSVRILYKEGDGGTWKFIDEVSHVLDQENENYDFIEGDDDIAGIYSFLKEKIYPIVPLDEASKNFDKLPPIAQAQGVSGNRLMYGNYQEGFDQVHCGAHATVVYKERFQDLTVFDVEASPILFTYQRQAKVKSMSTGFTIDTGGLPDEISPGLYEINFKFRPTRNLHHFNAYKSYLPSRMRTIDEQTTFIHDIETPNNYMQSFTDAGPIFDNELSLTGGTGLAAGVRKLTMFNNNGFNTDRPGAALIEWAHPWGDSAPVTVGQTPCSPLIFGIKEIDSSFVFEINSAISNSDLGSILDIAFTSEEGSNISNLISNQFDVNLIFSSSSSGQAGSYGVAAPKVELDLGLTSGQQINQTSTYAEMICSINGDGEGSDSAVGLSVPGPANSGFGCAGFFIINRADIEFDVKRVPTVLNPDNFMNVESVTQTSTKRGYYFNVRGIDTDFDNAFFSCFPRPAMGRGEVGTTDGVVSFKPNTPWRVFDNGTASDRRIIWPTVRGSGLKTFGGTRYYEYDTFPTGSMYCMPDGQELGNANMDDGGSVEDAVPYRIGDWLLLDQEDVIQGDLFEDWYSAKIDTSATGAGVSWSHSNLDSNDGVVVYGCGGVMTGVDDGQNFLARRHKITGSLSGAVHDAVGSLCQKWRGYIEPGSFNYRHRDDGTEYFTTDTFYDWTLSLIDGDMGPGGQMSIDSAFSNSSIGVDGLPENLTCASFNIGDTLSHTYATAEATGGGNQAPGNVDGTFDEIATGEVATHNRYGSVWNMNLFGAAYNLPYIDFTKAFLLPTAEENTASSSPAKEGAHTSGIMDNINIVSNFSGGGETELSFKTRATHDFGIAYYDKRGRRSTVNKLKSVYVPGYSDEERPDGTKGAVSINLDVFSPAPHWADRYKIFYSNRNETKRFIQYTAGGAFLEKNSDVKKGRIYVSLNYLQGNQMSYAQSYGAKDQDTDEPILYRYSKGDVLRIISYYKTETERVFLGPTYEFSVIGVETLSPLMEDHPLYSSSTFTGSGAAAEEHKRNGQFLVLKNNDKAVGFSAFELAAQIDNWQKRCVFEIASPLKESDEEMQPYFETAYGGAVLPTEIEQYDENGFLVHYHEQPEEGHLIEEGDVFFRQVPLNIRPFDATTQTFTDLIAVNEEGDDNSDSNFLPYYLESNSLTDLHRSNAKGYGKPNLIDHEAVRKRMQSSVIFSEKTKPNQFRLQHTAFSDMKDISFDLPEKHGALNYISGEDEYIAALQENKCSIIPVDRSITTTAAGTDSLNISDKVLNSAKFYFGEGGPAGNPESVVVVDGYIYFADKHNKRISRLAPGGQTVETISDLGMEEYFRRQFDRLLASSNSLTYSDIRIPAGFEPKENEFIVSFLRPDDINAIPMQGRQGTPLNHIGQESFASGLAKLELDGVEPFMTTIAFDHQGGKHWKTRYSFHSTNYASVNNKFLSFKPWYLDNLQTPAPLTNVWSHTDNSFTPNNPTQAQIPRNRFYGNSYHSMIKVVSTDSRGIGANGTKLYNTLSLESYYDWPAIIKTSSETAVIPTFQNYEGNRYAEIPRSSGTGTLYNPNRETSSTSQIQVVGKIQKIPAPEFSNHEFVAGFATIPGTMPEILAQDNAEELLEDFNWGAAIDYFTATEFYEANFPGSIGNEFTITFKNPVSNKSILLGEGVAAYIYVTPNPQFPNGWGLNPGQENVILGFPVEIVDDYTIRYLMGNNPSGLSPLVAAVGIDGAHTFAADLAAEHAQIVHVASSAVYGDKLRDQFATIALYSGNENFSGYAADKAGLYAVNVEVSDSKLNPST